MQGCFWSVTTPMETCRVNVLISNSQRSHTRARSANNYIGLKNSTAHAVHRVVSLCTIKFETPWSCSVTDFGTTELLENMRKVKGKPTFAVHIVEINCTLMIHDPINCTPHWPILSPTPWPKPCCLQIRALDLFATMEQARLLSALVCVPRAHTWVVNFATQHADLGTMLVYTSRTSLLAIL